ncbi:hypothetical protein COJ75_00150 [Bacillus thuringiensis]|nr:hypothetical protein COJ75_00150 [Bacillus thuringiensis]
MYRMGAKIAFEWYCLRNDINGKVEAFELIIQYITNGIRDDISGEVNNKRWRFFVEVRNKNFETSHMGTLQGTVLPDSTSIPIGFTLLGWMLNFYTIYILRRGVFESFSAS